MIFEQVLENQMLTTAQSIVEIANSNVISLRGELGSGKTTLIKNVLKVIGANELGSSPTFSIVNHHHDKYGKLLAYHLDCYRIESVEEALDFGIEDYLNADCYVFIEWPERIESLLPVVRTEISIRPVDTNARELTLINLPESPGIA